MNKVEMSGRLTRDPEIRYTSGGSSVANYSIAVNRRFKREGEPDADFFNCTAFGKGAEFVEKYLRKGMKIIVVGELRNETYTNKDGQKVTTTKIIVDEHEFCESKGSNGQSEQSQARPEPSQASVGDGFLSIPDLDDELPFD